MSSFSSTITLTNATKQHWAFWYRNPTNNLLQHVRIDSGRQAEIGHGWSAQQKAEVIKQLERAGARDAAEAHGRMSGVVTGYLYRDSGLVAVDEIYTAHEAVVEGQQKRSVDQAMKGAAGFDRVVNGGRRGQRIAKVTEVTVKQLPAPGERPTGNEVEFSMAIDPEGRSDVRLPA